MFRRREEIRQQLTEIIAKFKEKGATSPEKAMTAAGTGASATLPRGNA